MKGTDPAYSDRWRKASSSTMRTPTGRSPWIDDPRLEGLIEAISLDVHTVFGDGYLFLNYLKNMGLTPILRKVFSAEQGFQRCIAHLYHARMRNGGRDRCDHFVAKSFVSQTVRDVLNTGLAVDARFFDIMGDDDVRMLFFQEFVKMRRASDPEFGKCCYVDSTPIPNDIEDNPFNAFSSHDNPAPDVRRGQGRVVRIDPPNAQVKKVYRTFGIKLLNQFPLEKFIAETLS